MKVEIIKSYFYKNPGEVNKKGEAGEVINVMPEIGVELIGCLKALPADYPLMVELEVLQNFDSGDPNYGAISGKRGDILKLPRELATRLVYQRRAQPVDKSLWTVSFREPSPPPRNFIEEEVGK